MNTYEENVRLIYYVLNKYNKQGDDYFQEASIGLWKAVETFEPEKGFKFSSYAIKVMINQIFKFEDKMKRQNRHNTLSLDEKLDDSEDIYSLIGSGEDITNSFIIRDSLKKLINSLHDREKEIIKLKLQGKKQKDIGKALNLSQSIVSRIIINMKNKFNKY